MLKFIRKYKHILLVAFGVLLMVAFLLPQAITEMTSQRMNVTVMKIGQRKLHAKEHHALTMEYEAINRFAGGFLPFMGVPEGPEQWILLCELADRAGYIGAPAGTEMIEEIARTRALLALQRQYPGLTRQMLGFFQSQIDDTVAMTVASAPRVAAELHMTDTQVATALAKYKGVLRLINSYATAARVSAPRAVIRAERDLESAQIEYLFVPAADHTASVPEPDDAALQAFLEKYKDTKPGDGEFGIGYLLPARAKLEYLVLDAAKIGDRVIPDLRELRRRYSAQPNKDQSFDDARPMLEQQLKQETVERVMSSAREIVRSRIASATRRLADDGQFKVLPDDWASKRPTLESMTADIVAHVQEKTGVKIDPPEVVVKDASYLTAADLAALDRIGRSTLQHGQQRVSFAEYVLAVRELMSNTPLSLQVGVPAYEPTQDAAGSMFFFTILDTRTESTPRSIDEVRERLVTDWKNVQAYKLLTEQEAPAMLQKAIAEGIDSLDPKPATPPEIGKPLPAPKVKSSRITRTTLGSNDPQVNTDTFRISVIEASEKLNPFTPSDNYTAAERMLSVPLPQKLGVSIVRIVSVTPLTVEDFRTSASDIVLRYQSEEFGALRANPFSLDRLRTRLNVELVGAEGRNAAADSGS